jgi:type IV secretory pathway TraG/TraD family ATPase VirD4
MHLQNIHQLKTNYKTWQNFMSSCDKQFFAVGDEETAEIISKYLGEYIDKWQEGREGEARHIDKNRQLRTPPEVLEELRKKSGKQYILPTDGSPMRLRLVPFYKNFDQYGKVKDIEFNADNDEKYRSDYVDRQESVYS